MLSFLNWLASFGTWIAKLIVGDREGIIDGNAKVIAGFVNLIAEKDKYAEKLTKQIADMEEIFEEMRKTRDADREANYDLRLKLQKAELERDREFVKRIESNQKQQSG